MKRILSTVLVLALVSMVTFGQSRNRSERRTIKGPQKQMVQKQKMHRGGLFSVLTDEQKETLKAKHEANRKEMKGFQDELTMVRAELKVKTTADTPDVKAIEKLIDKKAKAMAGIEKAKMRMRIEIQSMLTDEQKAKLKAKGFAQKRMQGKKGGQGEKGKRPMRRARNAQCS